jgi:four helix bundle protein
MDKRELQERAKQFALRVLNLIDVLPRTAAGRAISSQLVRAATSVGANYRSACRARSRAEVAAKLGVDELTAILASGRKSAVSTSNIKNRTSYILS